MGAPILQYLGTAAPPPLGLAMLNWNHAVAVISVHLDPQITLQGPKAFIAQITLKGGKLKKFRPNNSPAAQRKTWKMIHNFVNQEMVSAKNLPKFHNVLLSDE